MTTDTNKLDTATTGQPHLAKQCLEGLDVNKLTPLSPEVGYHQVFSQRNLFIISFTVGHIPSSHHQYRYNWPRGTRQVHGSQGPVWRAHGQVQERAGA